MEFKDGDRVRIEGVVIRSNNINYPITLKIENGNYFTLTADGRYLKEGEVILQLVERPKAKVKKYRVLYEFNERLFVTQDYYKDLNDFKNIIKADMALQLLEATEKEFEE